jgi:ABC-type transport system substrate-binding protein
VSTAIDRQAINEAESLGFSGPTGNIVPRHQEFALAIDAPPYDPRRAKALLAEAGFPNGFDGGDFTPFPPYTGMGEAIVNYLAAVGIKLRMRTMERAALLTAWREKKIRNLFVGATGAAGNASRASKRTRRAAAPAPTAACRTSRRCSPGSCRRWTARSARRCCTRSSASWRRRA